jgi:hypothetical protein
MCANGIVVVIIIKDVEYTHYVFYISATVSLRFLRSTFPLYTPRSLYHKQHTTILKPQHRNPDSHIFKHNTRSPDVPVKNVSNIRKHRQLVTKILWMPETHNISVRV